MLYKYPRNFWGIFFSIKYLMITYWFPTGIYHSTYFDHHELKDEILKEIPNNEYLLDDNTITGWPFWTKQNIQGIINPLTLLNPKIQKFSTWVLEQVEHFSKHYNSTSSYKIDQCWANVYRKGDFQEPHIHLGFDFSAVYFVKAPPGSGKLVFENPLLPFEMRPIKTNNETELNTSAAVYAPVEGQLVIFRSNLRHGVYPHNNTEPRISLAFNLSEQ